MDRGMESRTYGRSDAWYVLFSSIRLRLVNERISKDL